MNRARRLAGAWRFAPPPSPPGLVVDFGSDRLRTAVAAALARTRAPGAQVVVRRRGELLWAARTAGVAATDRFVLASTTKPVVATLLCMLGERGALDLDAPVSTWLPGLPPALTPRLLLAHRSGLRDYTKDRRIARRMNGGDPAYAWTRGELIDAIVRAGAEREPDRRFAYRNGNYVIAAEIAERAGGRDIGALLDELIARPLGLETMSFSGSRLVTPHLVMLRRAVDLLAVTGGRVPSDAIGPVWGDGGVAASAADLARFFEALFAGELVTPAMLGQMVARRSRMGRGTGYGLGLTIQRRAGATLAGHDGMYFGWTASASIDDATATTVVALVGAARLPVPATVVANAARDALPQVIGTAAPETRIPAPGSAGTSTVRRLGRPRSSP